MPKKQKTVEQLDVAIAKWETKLKRTMTGLGKLKAARQRLAKRPRAHADLADMVGTFGLAVREAAQDAGLIPLSPKEMREIEAKPLAPPPAPVTRVIDPVPDVNLDAIPGFLQRKKLDPVAQQIADEQADLKKRKANIRIANLKAKKSGETKRMPLSGKAALDMIKNG